MLRPMVTGDGLLLRVRATAGRLNGDQATALADVAARFGNGLLDLSARGNLQLRGIRQEALPAIYEHLRPHNLIDEFADLEHVRTILCDPLAAEAPCLGRAIENALSAAPQLARLPAKFGFALDAGGPLPLPEPVADICYRRCSGKEPAYRVELTKSATTAAALGTVMARDLPALSVQLAEIYLSNINDDPIHLRRMKHLLTEKPESLAAFTNGLASAAKEDVPRGERRDAHKIGFASPGEPWIGFGLPFGRLSAADLRSLVTFAQKAGDGVLRLTPWRAILIAVTGEQSACANEAARQMATTTALYLDPKASIAQIQACPGSRGCLSGHFDTQEIAQSLATQHPVMTQSVHISGCAKGCACRTPTDLVIWGSAAGLQFATNALPEDRMPQIGRSEGEIRAIINDHLAAGTKGPQSQKINRLSRHPKARNDRKAPNMLERPTAPPLDYLKEGAAIYEKSFATIRAEADLSPFAADNEQIIVRMIHACGMVDLAADVAMTSTFTKTARSALENGAAIFCDAEMVAHGITKRRLPAKNEIICTLNEPSVPQRAAQIGTTRSAAALDLWLPRLKGAVVAIGNAPTALFRLLEMIDQGAPKPAAILGLPVGFVGAAESKLELSTNPRGTEWLVVHGRRGGSAMAVAAVNAVASKIE